LQLEGNISETRIQANTKTSPQISYKNSGMKIRKMIYIEKMKVNM